MKRFFHSPVVHFGIWIWEALLFILRGRCLERIGVELTTSEVGYFGKSFPSGPELSFCLSLREGIWWRVRVPWHVCKWDSFPSCLFLRQALSYLYYSRPAGPCVSEQVLSLPPISAEEHWGYRCMPPHPAASHELRGSNSGGPSCVANAFTRWTTSRVREWTPDLQRLRDAHKLWEFFPGEMWTVATSSP